MSVKQDLEHHLQCAIMTYNGSTVKAGLGQPTEGFQTRKLEGIRSNGVSQSLERDQKADMTAWVSFGKIVCNFSESKASGPLLHKTMSLLDSHHFYAAKPGVVNTLCIRGREDYSFRL